MRKLKKGRTNNGSTLLAIKEEELKAQLTRCLADYQNLINRVEREKTEIVARANKDLVENFLPVLDNLTRAQKHLDDEGLGMAIAEFEGVLREAGVLRIEIKTGDRFDENIHEVGEVVDLLVGGGDSGVVAEVTRQGYKWIDGTVLRPARVKVYKQSKN